MGRQPHIYRHTHATHTFTFVGERKAKKKKTILSGKIGQSNQISLYTQKYLPKELPQALLSFHMTAVRDRRTRYICGDSLHLGKPETPKSSPWVVWLFRIPFSFFDKQLEEYWVTQICLKAWRMKVYRY